MNFFGHAALACERRTQSAFVLGAMLPDFAGMIRARPPSASLAEIHRGIEFHHLTDLVFHDAPSFVRLSRRALAELTDLGVTRGAARAVAHVGVEILIDGELSRDQALHGWYLAALNAGHSERLGRHIQWRESAAAPRFDSLLASLSFRGASPSHADPETLALRLERTLAHRPRLALGPGDDQRIVAWARTARPRVVSSLPQLLSEVRSGIAEQISLRPAAR